MNNKQIFISKIKTKFNDVMIDNLLDELNFTSLANVFERGKHNMFYQIIRDRKMDRDGVFIGNIFDYNRFKNYV